MRAKCEAGITFGVIPDQVSTLSNTFVCSLRERNTPKYIAGAEFNCLSYTPK